MGRGTSFVVWLTAMVTIAVAVYASFDGYSHWTVTQAGEPSIGISDSIPCENTNAGEKTDPSENTNPGEKTDRENDAEGDDDAQWSPGQYVMVHESHHRDRRSSKYTMARRDAADSALFRPPRSVEV